MKIKIVLLGDMTVGKPSFINRYITGKFKFDRGSTLGVSFFTHKITIDGEEHLMEIWDTAGQERYRSLAPMYYRNSDVALIFFDLSNLKSYNSIDYWKNQLDNNMNKNLIQIVVGNKLDLINKETLNIKYKKHFLISTKENIDLSKLIKTAVRQVVEVNKNVIKKKYIIEEKPLIKKKSSCC